MRPTLPALIMAGWLLAGCGSAANPMNWFGNDAPDESVLEPIDADNPLIPTSSGLFGSDDEAPRILTSPIDAIADLTVERVPGGIVIRATGRSATQGTHNALLVPATADETPVDGVLRYTLEAQYTQVIGGAPQTREVIVARKLTDQELVGTRTIRVEGLQNALERRR